MSLKDKFNYIKDAIPKITKAYGKKVIGDVAENDEQQFRKSQCEACGLFNGKSCDKHILVHEGGEELEQVSFKSVEKSNYYVKIFDKSNILRKAISPDDKLFHRGCGCPQTGAAAKWKLSFTEKELAIKDGSGPCPMGKWSRDKFEQYKNEHDGRIA